MAILTTDGRMGNGAKKTRQGKGKNTKFGTKPQTHLGAVPKKTLNRYKKRKQSLGKTHMSSMELRTTLGIRVGTILRKTDLVHNYLKSGE